jgi:hypothetical protein
VKNGVAISMDREGSWRDKVFVERLWRSIKYEEVDLRASDTVREARALMDRHLTFYDGEGLQSTGGRRTEPTSSGCHNSGQLDPAGLHSSRRNMLCRQTQPPPQGKPQGPYLVEHVARARFSVSGCLRPSTP